MPASDVASGSSRSIWWTRRAVGLHLTIAVLVPAFCGLFWWQVQRVRQGNTLSWAYVFEWPFFVGYALYMWWKLLHDQPESAGGPGGTDVFVVDADAGDVAKGSAGVGADHRVEEDDEELAAYNRYLADLHASGQPKRW